MGETINNIKAILDQIRPFCKEMVEISSLSSILKIKRRWL